MTFGLAQESNGAWVSPRRPLGGQGQGRASTLKSLREQTFQGQGRGPANFSTESFHTELAWKARVGNAKQGGMPTMARIRVNRSLPHASGRVGATDTNNPVTEATPSPYRARLTGPVQFLKKLLETWQLDAACATVLLGLDPEDASQAANVLAGVSMLKGRDAKDRITHLYQIRKTLSGLFRDEHVENAWLREPHKWLNEKSPMDLILEGSMENLLLVREYVDAAAGR